MNLSKNVKIAKLVSGTTEVDPTNYDGVLFLGNGTKLEVADEKGDVAEVTRATAGVLYVDIYRPIESAGKLTATLTNASGGDLYAVLYQGRVKPDAWGTGELLISPVATDPAIALANQAIAAALANVANVELAFGTEVNQENIVAKLPVVEGIEYTAVIKEGSTWTVTVKDTAGKGTPQDKEIEVTVAADPDAAEKAAQTAIADKTVNVDSGEGTDKAAVLVAIKALAPENAILQALTVEALSDIADGKVTVTIKTGITAEITITESTE